MGVGKEMYVPLLLKRALLVVTVLTQVRQIGDLPWAEEPPPWYHTPCITLSVKAGNSSW